MKTANGEPDRESQKTAAAGERAARSRDAVKEELQNLLADLETLMQRIGDARDPELELLRARVKTVISSTRRAVEGHAEPSIQRARAAFSAGQAYVHERPWRVVGVAGLVGILVGALFTRR